MSQIALDTVLRIEWPTVEQLHGSRIVPCLGVFYFSSSVIVRGLSHRPLCSGVWFHAVVFLHKIDHINKIVGRMNTTRHQPAFKNTGGSVGCEEFCV